MKDWSIAEAKAQFSRLVADAVSEPQVLYNRGKPVAAVINYDVYQQIKTNLEANQKRPLKDLLAELRTIDDEADLEIPERINRSLPPTL